MNLKQYLNRKLQDFLFKKSAKQLEDKYFVSIEEMPMWNWDKLHQQNDVSFILKKPFKANRFHKIFLMRVWQDLSDQYIERFGIPEYQLNRIKKERAIARLKLRVIIEGDNSLKTNIEIKEKELANEIENAPNVVGDIIKTKRLIEKALDFHYAIDLKICAVLEFYTYLEDITKKN